MPSGPRALAVARDTAEEQEDAARRRLRPPRRERRISPPARPRGRPGQSRPHSAASRAPGWSAHSDAVRDDRTAPGARPGRPHTGRATLPARYSRARTVPARPAAARKIMSVKPSAVRAQDRRARECVGGTSRLYCQVERWPIASTAAPLREIDDPLPSSFYAAGFLIRWVRVSACSRIKLWTGRCQPTDSNS